MLQTPRHKPPDPAVPEIFRESESGILVAPGPLASASPFPDARELELEREPGRARPSPAPLRRNGIGTREPAAGGPAAG
jgi:hypothetical protein